MIEDEISKAEFDRFRTLIYNLTGINLSETKRSMLVSRLGKNLRAINCSSYEDYYNLLCSLPAESEQLSDFINAVTTNTTHFFREPHHFEHFANVYVPQKKQYSVDKNPSLRIWHAGCSTGEEPYTLSMVLHESLGEPDRWDIKQLATDIDTRALMLAETGLYDADKLESVPKDIRCRYFLRSKDRETPMFKIKPVTKEWLIWRKLNLLDERFPFRSETQFDAIFCRNVMIYFDKGTQKTLVEKFSRHLAPGGMLYIGHSESLFGISSGLKTVGQTTYQKDAELKAQAA